MAVIHERVKMCARMAVWFVRERKELLRVEGNQEVKTMKLE